MENNATYKIAEHINWVKCVDCLEVFDEIHLDSDPEYCPYCGSVHLKDIHGKDYIEVRGTTGLSRCVFELVREYPRGYEIWNIGTNMVDGYLPLCKSSVSYDVEVDTLKAVKVNGAQTILSAVGLGVHSIKEMEIYLTAPKDKDAFVTKRVKAALPYLRNIPGLNENMMVF